MREIYALIRREQVHSIVYDYLCFVCFDVYIFLGLGKHHRENFAAFITQIKTESVLQILTTNRTMKSRKKHNHTNSPSLSSCLYVFWLLLY